MKFKFYYRELIPSYESYRNLIHNLKEMSKEFYSLDKIFEVKFNHLNMKKYENNKQKIISQMFKELFSTFNILNKVPCAIYINGSFARGNITSGSDMDLTFIFKKEDVFKYQALIYLIRYAISIMFNVNIVHIHSFTKNFTTEFRQKNNLVIFEQKLKTTIIWTYTNESFDIDYPENQMIPEREICEISSMKDINSLTELYKKQIATLHPKEWIYTHKCVFINNNEFSIENLIKKLDKLYNKSNMSIILNNLKQEIMELIKFTSEYYESLALCKNIELSKFNMIGKRKIFMLISTFAVYIRWYHLFNNDSNFPLYLDLNEILNYKSRLIENKTLHKLYKDYYYYRYLISRIEIWARNYNHHFEHRSKEVVDIDVLNSEYVLLYGKEFLPIDEQIKVYNNLIKNIKKILNN